LPVRKNRNDFLHGQKLIPDGDFFLPGRKNIAVDAFQAKFGGMNLVNAPGHIDSKELDHLVFSEIGEALCVVAREETLLLGGQRLGICQKLPDFALIRIDPQWMAVCGPFFPAVQNSEEKQSTEQKQKRFQPVNPFDDQEICGKHRRDTEFEKQSAQRHHADRNAEMIFAPVGAGGTAEQRNEQHRQHTGEQPHATQHKQHGEEKKNSAHCLDGVDMPPESAAPDAQRSGGKPESAPARTGNPAANPFPIQYGEHRGEQEKRPIPTVQGGEPPGVPEISRLQPQRQQRRKQQPELFIPHEPPPPIYERFSRFPASGTR